MKTKILMVGATGTYASLVLPELKKRGATVRALLRDERKSEEARGHGADGIAVGDLTDRESLHRAADGVDGVYHLNPAFAPDEAELGVAMVESAKEAGVRKFLFSGAIHPSLTKLANHRAKLPVQEALYESGMEFTVLQPAMFMQTLAGGWNAVMNTGVFGVPYSKHKKACYVDFRDVAEVAAIALTGDELAFGTFELCAPGMLDRVELAQLMSDVLGRTIEATEPPFEEWAEKSGVPSGQVRDGLAKMYAHYNEHGFPGGNALVLKAILGHEPRTMRQFLEELPKSPNGAS